MDVNLRVRVFVLHERRLLLLPPGQEGGETWTLPGGGLEAGETLTECAAREVQEETGVAVRIGDVAFLRERPWVFRSPGRPEETGLCLEVYFHGRPVGDEICLRAEANSALPCWVSLAEAARLPLRPTEAAAQVHAFLTGGVPPGVVCYPP